MFSSRGTVVAVPAVKTDLGQFEVEGVALNAKVFTLGMLVVTHVAIQCSSIMRRSMRVLWLYPGGFLCKSGRLMARFTDSGFNRGLVFGLSVTFDTGDTGQLVPVAERQLS